MGSILADEMGLGKTISAISLLTTLYTTAMEKDKNTTNLKK
jgi:SNF2 family DNA or RNA helicase